MGCRIDCYGDGRSPPADWQVARIGLIHMVDVPIRTHGREFALRLLYAHEITNGLYPSDDAGSVRAWWEPDDDLELEERARQFGLSLWEGVQAQLNDIDQAIQKAASHWKLERIAPVDRNLLRLGVYEIVYCADIPVEVTISELVNLAKHYGDGESGAFLNGILDAVAKSLTE